MKCFALGPVEMFPFTLEVSKQQIPYFRTPEFSAVMLDSEKRFKRVLNAREDDKVIFLTASGTAAMEATVFNCFTQEDKLLIINGGIFGKRFVEICEAFSYNFESVDLKFGEILTEKHLEEYEGMNFSALLVNIHETSTGQLYNIQLLSDFCKRNKMYFVVDAISSVFADEYNIDRYEIDATILSSQKGLAIGPGMSFVLLSESLWREKVSKNNPPSLYFDFKDYVENQKRGQTPYTPAVRVALELNDMLVHIEEEGIEHRIAHVETIASDFREKIKSVEGVHIPEYPLSNASTPILFDNFNADMVYEIMKNKYGIVLTPCGGDLKHIMVRMGHIGNHTLEENDLVIDVLKRALLEAGMV